MLPHTHNETTHFWPTSHPYHPLDLILPSYFEALLQFINRGGLLLSFCTENETPSSTWISDNPLLHSSILPQNQQKAKTTWPSKLCLLTLELVWILLSIPYVSSSNIIHLVSLPENTFYIGKYDNVCVPVHKYKLQIQTTNNIFTMIINQISSIGWWVSINMNMYEMFWWPASINSHQPSSKNYSIQNHDD